MASLNGSPAISTRETKEGSRTSCLKAGPGRPPTGQRALRRCGGCSAADDCAGRRRVRRTRSNATTKGASAYPLGSVQKLARFASRSAAEAPVVAGTNKRLFSAQPQPFGPKERNSHTSKRKTPREPAGYTRRVGSWRRVNRFGVRPRSASQRRRPLRVVARRPENQF